MPDRTKSFRNSKDKYWRSLADQIKITAKLLGTFLAEVEAETYAEAVIQAGIVPDAAFEALRRLTHEGLAWPVPMSFIAFAECLAKRQSASQKRIDRYRAEQASMTAEEKAQTERARQLFFNKLKEIAAAKSL